MFSPPYDREDRYDKCDALVVCQNADRTQRRIGERIEQTMRVSPQIGDLATAAATGAFRVEDDVADAGLAAIFRMKELQGRGRFEPLTEIDFELPCKQLGPHRGAGCVVV